MSNKCFRFIYYYSIEASGSQKQKGKIPLYNAIVSESKQDRPFSFQVKSQKT